MNTGGKGSKARPLSIPRNQFEDNWDRIFGKKKSGDKNGKSSNKNSGVAIG